MVDLGGIELPTSPLSQGNFIADKPYSKAFIKYRKFSAPFLSRFNHYKKLWLFLVSIVYLQPVYSVYKANLL
jgi:hypothetical protein